MRSTTIGIRIPTRDAAAALAAIADFPRFPALADDVRAVEPRDGGHDWTVNFRRGLMRWHERETVDAEQLRIEFTQTEGDFAEFAGSWQLTPVAAGCDVLFAVTYDFGIDSMAGILDPIAERVIKRIACSVLNGLFGHAMVTEGGEALVDLHSGKAA